jgi:hypothetical protein
MQIFSPDGKYGYVCSSFNPEVDVVTVADHQISARVKQASPFCPNIAATLPHRQFRAGRDDSGGRPYPPGRRSFRLSGLLPALSYENGDEQCSQHNEDQPDPSQRTIIGS